MKNMLLIPKHICQLKGMIVPLICFPGFTYVASVCISISKLTKNDAYLENYLFSVTPASSVLDCAMYCLATSDCLSFGSEPQTGSCHLHTENSTPGTRELCKRVGWLHGDTDAWSKMFWGPCSDHNCRPGERCILHRITNAPLCVKANTVLPPGHCPLPPVTLNARISPGQQRKGIKRTYTCNKGYLDLSSEEQTAVITCMGNGEWSPLSLNCSGPYVRIESPSLSTYKFALLSPQTLQNITGNFSTLIFWTKSCHDSNFGIYFEGNVTSKDKMYEIIIGGWMNHRSAIRTCSDCSLLAEHIEANVLSCKEFRPFWLSWQNGTIVVGKGCVPGLQIFMDWTPPAPLSVSHVGISSYIHNKATWLFLLK